MSFYKKLSEKLKGKVNVDELPRSYNILGKILLVKLKPSLYKKRKLIGRTIMEIVPYVHSVVLLKDIVGKKRKPKIEVIAGCKDTLTLHKEHGAKFFIDVSKTMWSKGNKEEKSRMINLVKKNEIVVDMFSGIGYWTIFLAKKARRVYAMDINKDASELLRKNVWMNGVESKVEILEGDCRKFSSLLNNSADRIIMGYIYETEKFLPHALKMIKKKGIIHFHRNAKEEDVEKIKKMIKNICKENNYNVSIKYRKIKSYSPRVYHMVFDLKVLHI